MYRTNAHPHPLTHIPASPISEVLPQTLFLLLPLPSPSKTRVCCVVCRARGSREVHPPSCLICRREWQYPAYNGLVAGTTTTKQHFCLLVTTLAASFHTAWLSGHHDNPLHVSPLSFTIYISPHSMYKHQTDHSQYYIASFTGNHNYCATLLT